MLTEAYLEPSRTSTITFFTLVKPYFKNILNSIKLPLGSIFYMTYPFVKKAYNSENIGRKSLLLTVEPFFEILNYAMEWCHQ